MNFTPRWQSPQTLRPPRKVKSWSRRWFSWKSHLSCEQPLLYIIAHIDVSFRHTHMSHIVREHKPNVQDLSKSKFPRCDNRSFPCFQIMMPSKFGKRQQFWQNKQIHTHVYTECAWFQRPSSLNLVFNK